ncbi:MAG: hypothetical protein ACI4RR_01680 [Eubacterium sp.]
MEEEIKEEILDSPLIVHKKTDASYQETASEVGMQTTHIDEDSSDEPTLERHRFKKKKKKKKWPYVLIALIVIAVAVLAVLFNKGVISLHQKESTTAPRKSYTTQAENKFENTITIKGTYLFFEGQEIDGIGELEREIKYLDKGTKFVVQDENANSDFLNFEVLSLLSKYEMEYDITHIVSSGLTSFYEITTQPSQTTQPQSQEAQPEPSQAQ